MLRYQRYRSKQGGFTILEAVIGLGIASVIIAFVSKSIGTQFRATSSVSRLTDLDMVKLTIMNSVNCQRTLNAPPPPDIQVACSSSSYTLRRADGSEIPNPIGIWELSAKCVDNVLDIQVRPNTPDPLIKEASMKWRPLFPRGTSELCRSYFVKNPCPNDEVAIGTAGGIPVCGPRPIETKSITVRSQSAGTNTGMVRVECNPDEIRLSCDGSRHPSLKDTCEESDCGFIGVRPFGTHGCAVGIDDAGGGDSGSTKPTVFAVCMKPPY